MADDDDLFVKDGEPVKFCFHRSVTQGRSKIRRDVERHGGQIVDDERTANVLLVDEQEDIDFLRRRYYSSTVRYRLSIYVELRGFVQACIRSGTYHHVGPVKQGMPGRPPGRGMRPRVAFTQEDRAHLAYYLATRCPTRDGRMGNSAYKDLERLGQSEDASWAWASRHTWHSWREHYKTRPHIMDPMIDHYVQRFKNVGHHFGYDARSHDHRNLRRHLAEEEEEEEEPWEGVELQEQQDRQAQAPRPREQAARDYLARHEEDLFPIGDEDEEEPAIVPQRVNRHRVLPDARRQRDTPVARPRRARSTDERQASDEGPTRENTETQESQEIEGSDLFGDREYEDYNNQVAKYPAPFSSPRQDGPPPSTQATLVASPRFAEKEPPLASFRRPIPMVEDRAQMPPPSAPSSPELTLVMRETHAVGIRIPIRGASAEPGPSVPREKKARSAVEVESPFPNTRARSRSADRPQRGDRKRTMKEEEPMEDVRVEEERSAGHASVNTGKSAADEMAVEDLLDDDTDESDLDLPKLPPYEEIEVESEPSDSDDKETHGALARGVVKDEPILEEEDEEAEAARIERMANGKLIAVPVPTPPEPRVTRSKTASQKISPRRTRSATQRAARRSAKRSWEHHDGRARSPSYKRHRGRDERWRDERKRDSRDRREYRSRERERERDSRRHSRDRRDHRRRDDTRHRTPAVDAAVANGRPPPPQKPDSDREEGEISPRSPARPPSRTPEDRPEPQVAPLPKPRPELELELDADPAASEEASRAARRARRQAILAKYTGIASNTQSISPSPGPSSAVQPPQPVSSLSDLPSQPHSAIDPLGARMQNGSSKRDSASPAPDPGAFELAKDEDEGKARTNAQAQDGTGEQISAADYDPSLDRREDARRAYNGEQMDLDLEEVEEVEDEDDVDDMFAISSSEKRKKVKKVKKVVKPSAPALITTTLDSASDPDGYYQVILGEQLDGGRYQVFSSLGKGMFANVVRARVLQDAGEGGKEVAIKIIRSQESMYRAGLKEVQILNKLRQADPDDKKHIVRLERTFEHRGHLCLVFESMSMNLRDVVKRFGKDVGLNIKAVRAYAHQLFLSLSLLKKTNIMHADIKPDNILVNEQKTLLKLCDLGSASDASENDITPYLVSRFYRAPEIILGVPYDPALDVWSIGCTLYELYTGKILFPGRSNNQMLLFMMELKGRFNARMIKKAKFGDMYFDEQGGFENVETDRVTGANVVRKVHMSKPTRDLRARLMPPSSVKMKDEEMKLLLSFVDLLDKCLALDPARRLTPKEALVHPFIRG